MEKVEKIEGQESTVPNGFGGLEPSGQVEAVENALEALAEAGAPLSLAELPPSAAPKRRGFAAMNPDLVREISRKGGRAAHAAGTAHEFTSEEARAAGRKGGKATHAKRRVAAAAQNGDQS